jgi:amino acid transporter
VPIVRNGVDAILPKTAGVAQIELRLTGKRQSGTFIPLSSAGRRSAAVDGSCGGRFSERLVEGNVTWTSTEARLLSQLPSGRSPRKTHKHGLAANAIGLLQSIVISVANSAPTAAMTVTFAALVVVAAGGGAIAIFITMLPMLVIAYSFQRLNRWEANCGAQYVWVGRAVGPRLGFMTGWIVLGALMLGTVATVLPVGPSFLDLVGLDSSSQFGSVASSTVLMLIVMVVAVLGITLTARIQLAMAAIEYAIVGVLTVIGLWDTFVSQPHGFVSPTWSWLSPTGVGGAGDLVGTLLLAVFLIAGWDASLYVNEETENAEVNPGRAVMISVVFLGLFYMLMMFAFQAVAPATKP